MKTQKKQNRIKNTPGDTVLESINFILVTLIFICVAYPLVFVISASVSDPNMVTRGEVWLLPKGITFEGYRRIFVNNEIWRGYLNTIIYTITGALFTLALTLSCAYGLSFDNFPGKKLITIIFTITMFFGGGLIPYFMVVRNLGLYDKYFTLPILGGVGFYNIVIARTYIKTSIPRELLEASVIDGCTRFGTFFRIVLPLAKPITAVIGLYAAVGQWNSYFNALIFLNTRVYQPLQIILREILTMNTIDFSSMQFMEEESIALYDRAKVAQLIKYAVMIVSSLPIIMMYPFIQKYFVKGIMVGSVKG